LEKKEKLDRILHKKKKQSKANSNNRKEKQIAPDIPFLVKSSGSEPPQPVPKKPCISLNIIFPTPLPENRKEYHQISTLRNSI